MVTKAEIDKYCEAYAKGEPMIDDATYDILLEEYINGDESKRPYNRQKQSAAVNDVVGTLSKVYGVTTPMRPELPTYLSWLSKTNISNTICIQPKFDGCSIAIDFTDGKFYTRGDYDNGESVDVTELFQDRNMSSTTLKSAKFEAIMSDETFDALNLSEKYLRARDAVSATITSRNNELAKYITLVPLRQYTIQGSQTLPEELFDISQLVKYDNTTAIEDFINQLLSNGAKVEYLNNMTNRVEHYAVDGVVVSSVHDDNGVFRITNDEVAIKILNKVANTKLLSVIFQTGTSGRVTPVAIVEPVMFDNITVTRITLSSLNRLQKLHLKQNDTVSIMYNIVPYLVSSEHDGDVPIQLPKQCPFCGTDYDLSTLGVVSCKNKECISLKLGAIIRYCEKMRMFGLSEGKISTLYDAGIITSISSLYKLDKNQISILDGFGEVSADNIIDTIYESSQNVQVHEWLGSFPMNGVGKRTIKKLLLNIPDTQVLDYIKNNDLVSFVGKILITNYVDKSALQNPGNIMLNRFISGIDNNWDELRNTISYIHFIIKSHNGSDKRVVTMTGTRDSDLTKYLENKNYQVEAFTKQTEILIIPNRDFKSKKVTKAEQLGIPIYTIEEAYEKL